MPPANANSLLAHLTTRIRTDIDFLVSEGYISSSDGQLINSKLPKDSSSASYNVKDAANNLANTHLNDGPRGHPGSPTRESNGKVPWKAKAIWGYNEDNSVSWPFDGFELCKRAD